MLNDRLDLLNDYPFQRLADLLAGVTPRSNEKPLMMAVGEPQHQPPDFARQIIDREAATWHRYPPINGTPAFRAACANWLGRRYKIKPGSIDPETQISPLSGSREGLFISALLAISRGKGNGQAPVALMPNPFYQVYFGAAVMAGAEPVFLRAAKETGFFPDLDAIGKDVLARTQIMYLCSPANPQGTAASLDYLKKAIGLACEYDFLLVSDECYAEIYTGDEPPAGALDAAAALGGRLDNLLVLHTLSKRSSAPGLRSAFAVGAPTTIARLNRLRSYSCAAIPLPIVEASTALWNDEEHAVATRALYRAKADIAEKLLAGRFGFYRPVGGFFLWLDVGDGEAACKTLWQEAGIRTLPGAYVTKPEANGENFGKSYLRVALVHDLETTETALTRLAKVL
jgi:N-succinyldiaminopimelate aminotransferase